MTVSTMAIVSVIICAAAPRPHSGSDQETHAPQQSPSAAVMRTGPYALPFKASDLKVGEYLQTDTHELGIQGIQADGKDIVVQRAAGGANWSMYVAGNRNIHDVNDYVVYGRPFYAMADGVVVGCWRNAPQNTPGDPNSSRSSDHPVDNPDYDAGRFAPGGNHIWILQTDGAYALYAHAQPGSIPAAICPHDAVFFDSHAASFNGNPDIDPHVAVTNGAHIRKGQFLGRVGVVGSTPFPHLHVHMEKNGHPWPMDFEHALVTPFQVGQTTVAGPWTDVVNQTLPGGPILVWPDDGTVTKCNSGRCSGLRPF